MNERIELLKKQFDFSIGEKGTIVPYNPPKEGEAGDNVHSADWTYIKMDKGGYIDGAYTEGIDYEIIVPNKPDIKAEMSNRELTDHIELTYGTPKDGQVKFKIYFDAAKPEEMAKKVDNTFLLMDTLKKANRIPE